MFRFPDSALPLNLRRTGWAATACLAVAAVVAGCGGGTRVSEFQPTQVVAFGDEYSAFDTVGTVFGSETLKGLRYTVNSVGVGTTYCLSTVSAICASDSSDFRTVTDFVGGGGETFSFNSDPVLRQVTAQESGTGTATEAAVGSTPVVGESVKRFIARRYRCSAILGTTVGIWVQTLAQGFGSGLSFGGDQYCSTDSGNAKSYAAWGANVAAVVTQVNSHLAELHKGTLVTMLAGQNDIFEVFSGVLSDEAGIAELTTRGRQLAVAVNDIAATGAKVVVVTVPNLRFSPSVIADGRVARMQALVYAFNHGMTLALNDDGRKIGLVDAYVAFGASAVDANDFACDPALVKKPDGSATSGDQEKLLYCTSESLKTNGAAKLWADAKHLGPIGHATLATLAFNRARQNF
ncbi:MAG: hypothetical protein V4532_07425 [Pseudomonadota bacterium]